MDVSVMADISTLDVPQKVLPLSGHHVMTNVHVVYYSAQGPLTSSIHSRTHTDQVYFYGPCTVQAHLPFSVGGGGGEHSCRTCCRACLSPPQPPPLLQLAAYI